MLSASGRLAIHLHRSNSSEEWTTVRLEHINDSVQMHGVYATSEEEEGGGGEMVNLWPVDGSMFFDC